jgi:glycosyltransferase involved in cell wall biosynthesis
MTIWIDAKNPALYSSGISFWLHGLIKEIDQEIAKRFLLIAPDYSDKLIYPDLSLPIVKLKWQKGIPKRIAHILYDNFTFRRFAKKKKPSAIFSPYFDVLMPKNFPYVITVHDVCYLEAAESYPLLQRNYFIFQMKRNIRRATKIVTVSKSSKKEIINLLGVNEEKIIVIENVLETSFLEHQPTDKEISTFRAKFPDSNPLILYTAGFENRKNISNLLLAIKLLTKSHPLLRLLVTGGQSEGWLKLIGSDQDLLSRVVFSGFLTNQELKTAYLAADIVVSPSLSEGYGRSCIEALATGTPLACSDIPVFHEVAGIHASYFDPHHPHLIAAGIEQALNRPRQESFIKDSSERLVQIRELEDCLLRIATL